MFKTFSINGRNSELLGIKDFFSLFPYPVVEETRKGPGCENCGDECSGHYVTDLTTYINLYSHSKAVRSQPPRQILQDYRKTENFSDPDIQNQGRKCLLGPEEVKLWLEHLHQVEENRSRGAEKARVSRQRREKKIPGKLRAREMLLVFEKFKSLVLSNEFVRRRANARNVSFLNLSRW